jgi:hypothetical protein
MISTTVGKTPESYDPWIVPSLNDCPRYGDKMRLSLVELAYQAIQSATPSPRSLLDTSPDPFHVEFHTDEMILTVMSMEYIPWDDGHYRSILFLEPETIESYQRILNPSTVMTIPPVSEPIRDVFYEGNLGNISPTIPLDILIKHGIVENVHISASCPPY